MCFQRRRYKAAWGRGSPTAITHLNDVGVSKSLSEWGLGRRTGPGNVVLSYRKPCHSSEIRWPGTDDLHVDICHLGKLAFLFCLGAWTNLEPKSTSTHTFLTSSCDKFFYITVSNEQLGKVGSVHLVSDISLFVSHQWPSGKLTR